MRRFLYVGSFDPITDGHLDIIGRASKLCDELYVGVGINASKTPMFTTEEREAFILEATSHLDNIKVCEVPGLTVDKARELNATLIRGIRDTDDLCREQQIAGINSELDHNIETIYLISHIPYVSSSAVKEIFKLGGSDYDLWKLVPPCVVAALLKRRKGPSEPR